VRCLYDTDTRTWLRLGIGALGILPFLLLVGHQRRAGLWVSWTVWAAGAIGAILLALRQGLVPASFGDCPPYPQCYTHGRPYLLVALALFLGATAMAIWLWDKDYPKPITRLIPRPPARANARSS
jgi:hypothetical protein